ncbi:hypothetical protein [Glutamicibacter ardleyensis]|uniref:hypothetical protein n=1 Tax=Glutamicibacter ardleyensis TaxID=225894 RepID=UPI003FD1022D
MTKRMTPMPTAEMLLGQRFQWDLSDSYEVGSLLMLIRISTWKRTPLRELLGEYLDNDEDFGETLNLSTLAWNSGNPRLRPIMVDTVEQGDSGKEVLVTYQFHAQMDEPTPDFLTDCIPWLTGVGMQYSVNVECSYTYVDKPHRSVAFGYWEQVRRGGKFWLRQGHVPAE